jgi:hypothetical protein
MRFKRWMLIATTFLMAMAVMIALVKCSTTEVSADPIVGPPTIEMHLANINSNMQLIKWMAGGLTAMLGLVGSLIAYIFKSTIANLKSSIGHVEKKAEKALKKTDEIEREFMSIATHDRICRDKQA